MPPRSARDRTVLFVAGVLAVGVPLAGWRHLDGRRRELETALGATAGAAVEIGGVEATLTGSVRLSDVIIGDALSATSVEASVSLASLFAGDLGADEVRIDGPRLHLRLDADGDSNVARMVRRVAARRPPRPADAGGGHHRLRRIVVTGGDLVAQVALGEGRGGFIVEVAGVELHPQERGVRLVTGPVEIAGGGGPWQLRGRFVRAGADVDLVAARIDRALAVGGSLRVDGDDAVIELRHADFAHGVGGDEVRLDAAVDAAGAPRLSIVGRRGHPGSDAGLTITGHRLPLAILAPIAPTGVRLADAIASGEVAREASAAGLAIRLDAEIAGLIVDHPTIAAAPVDLAGHAALRARLHTDESGGGRSLDVDELAWIQGALHTAAHGRVEIPARGRRPARADLTFELKPAPCQDALYALPEALRDRLAGLTLRGEIAARIHLRWDLDAADPAEVVALDAAVDAERCQVIEDAVTADPAILRKAFAHSFADGSQAVIGPGRADWVELRHLPSHVVGAFVAAEDARFWEHPGFDLVQIGRSLGINLAAGDLLRGGSTISQQLAKNVFLSHHRNLARKLQEAVLTWRLEAALDKRTILERYLNLIELGPGIYGVGAAARRWFDKPAAQLSVAEAAFLAAITPEPTTMSARIAAAGGLDDRSRERVEVVLRAMRRGGVIDASRYDRARRHGLGSLRAVPTEQRQTIYPATIAGAPGRRS